MNHQKICVLVWNDFAHDARVLRIIETLVEQQADVSLLCLEKGSEVKAETVSSKHFQVYRTSLTSPLSAFLTQICTRLDVRVGVIGTSGQGVLLAVTKLLRRAIGFLLFVSQVVIGQLRIYRLASQLSPTIVHGNDVNTLPLAWLISRKSNALLVYDAHEISADREGYRLRSWLVRSVEGFLVQKAAAMITTTGMRAEWFQEHYNVELPFVVQNRPAQYETKQPPAEDLVAFPTNSFVVVYQGGLQPGRGLRNLVDAVRDLPSVHLLMVGDGAQRRQLEDYSSDISQRVHFVGMKNLSELPAWTALGDVGVQVIRNTCFNHYSTDSNKLFEYVAAGLPVIASDFPEISKIVKQWDLGILVDPDDPSEVREAIRLLSEDAALSNRYKQNARRAGPLLDWSSQERILISSYQHALSG